MNRNAILTLLLSLLVGLIVCIVWASLSASVFTALKEMLVTPWGATTLLDLYIGLAVVAIWIALLEGSWRRSLLWILMLPFFGNLVTLIYFLQRLAKRRSVSETFLGRNSSSHE